MKQYELFELEFMGNEPEASHVHIELKAEFTVRGKTKTVKGFYAGGDRYVVRFYPETAGNYVYKITGAVEAEGSVFCEEAKNSGNTEANGHGMVKTEGTHFRYEDGTPYYPFGTTIYALVHQEEELIEETFQSLGAAPFNKVRHCIFPKHYDYNHNEPQFYPFERKADGSWDVDHPCFAYWDHFEKCIFRLQKLGIETDLILFHAYDRWGFSALTMEDNLTYLEYVLRRLSAIPSIWWSLANEYDIVFTRTMADWYTIENFVAENDPYHHLLSNHNCIKLYDFSRENITHCCVQTNAMHMTDEWMRKYNKPVVYDECCYEGDIQHEWGNISGFEMANRFWKACAKGAYATHGETFYSEDEILWWARGGKLKGKSPERIAYLKEFIYSLPGALEPWDEPIYEDFENATLSGSVNGDNPFFELIKSNPPVDAANLAWKNGAFNGRIGDKVYLKYYGSQCSRISFIKLPKEYTYKIELIDMWEMTRETMVEKASGHTNFRLPGKEGMAVVATRI